MSDVGLVLREFVASDDAALAGWFAGPAELVDFSGDSLTWPVTSAQLDELRHEPGRVCRTAIDPAHPDVVAGHVEFVTPGLEAGCLHVSRVAVAPGLRGRGYGRALMTAAAGYARDRGYRALDLNVVRGNAPAQGLYAACGFEPVPGARPVAVAGGDMIAMVLRW